MSFASASFDSLASARLVLSANAVNTVITPSMITGYVKGMRIELIVNAGVYLYSNNIATPALSINGFSPLDDILLIVNGIVMGKGGAGGGYVLTAPVAAQNGGTALSISSPVTIEIRAGYVLGGGGGGGAAGNGAYIFAGGGGGAGGGDGAHMTGYNYQNQPVNASGGAGGGLLASGGVGSYAYNNDPYYPRLWACGGGGGRVFGGSYGAGASYYAVNGQQYYGGAGGGEAGAGGAIMIPNAASGYTGAAAGGGGGGWGASGGAGRWIDQGSLPFYPIVGGSGGSNGLAGGDAYGIYGGTSGGAGGLAIALNGNPNRVDGAGSYKGAIA